MISIDFNNDSKKAEIKFSGNNFTNFVGMFKLHHFSFDITRKVWEATPGKLLSILDDINDIEPLEIDDTLMEKLKKYEYGEKETKFVRKAYRSNLCNFTPLGDFQSEDIKKFITQNRLICGHEVGLGKTPISIVGFSHYLADNQIDKILIVTVSETVYNWKRELKIFGNFTDEDILIIIKDNRNIMEQWNDKKIIIMTYNTFILCSDYYYQDAGGKKGVKGYRKPPIDFSQWGTSRCLILDEGHKAKNHSSRTYKTLNLHKKFFDYRYILTATPYPNDITEVWSLMNLLDESVLGDDYYEFLERVASIGNRFSAYAINYFKIKEVEKVVDKLKPFLIRRFKKECLPNLPDLIIKKIYVEPSKDFLEIYQAVITRELVRIKEEKGSITFKEVKNKFPYLTLACSDPSILKEKFDASWSFDLTTRINNWKINKNPKLTIVNDLLAEHKGEKIIIWSTHPVTLDLLGEYYKKYVPIVIHGQTDTGDLSSAEYRDNELTRFRTSKDCNLAIISPLCLGVGVNIPESSIAIHFDRNWSAVVYLQSIGRNHRATSTKDVTQYVLLMDETLELIQDNALDGKVNLNNNLMKKDILSNEEWNKIFSGKSDAFLLFE